MTKDPLAKARSDLSILIHLHIPKTAGRSLNTLLRPLYSNEAQVHATGASPERKIQEMSAEARDGIRLVAGHCSHGVHLLLPHPARYLVILRAPGPRLLSLYKYIFRTPSHPLHPILHRGALQFGDFLELAEDRPHLRAELHNGQMRRIAGDMTPEGIGREDELLNLACAHLASPNMTFGFTEQFDRFVAKLKTEGILPDATPPQVNVAPPGLNFERACATLSRSQKERLKQYCAYDERMLAFAYGQAAG
ncbi:MAG: sulfotransferase family 2 domain-containing protein [Flavobacteriaceae bacterium]|nr:sulfotransferase family 2 domain-containing protein [Flavobacteriaceae bacterium]